MIYWMILKKETLKNIITKDEQIELDDQNKANKIFGSFDDNNINAKKNYNVIIFDLNKNLLFLEMIFEIENNIQSQIIDKVLNSLKFEK